VKAVLVVSLLFLAFSNLDLFWKLYMKVDPGRMGGDLGVIRYELSGDTFEGVVTEGIWMSMTPQEQESRGSAFAQSMIGKGIPRVILRDTEGNVIARTMKKDGKLTWLVFKKSEPK
jgi:hypothetical protein